MYYNLTTIRRFKERVSNLIHNPDLEDIWEFGICCMTNSYGICYQLFREIVGDDDADSLPEYGKLTDERIFILLLLNELPAQTLLEMVNQ